MSTKTLTVLLLLAAAPGTAIAQPYTARLNDDVVELEDAGREMTVSILTSVGHMAYSFRVNGHDVLRFPFPSVDTFRERPSGLNGIPLLAPWANRLDEQAFYANGTRYAFDMDLGNVNGTIPIHGFLSRADRWEVVEVRADANAAWVTSRLDVYRNPEWMQQWPFAHTIEMTYRLESGVLEVRTRVHNLANQPMPVALGYHPYFRLTDSPRAEWTITVPARTRWLLDSRKVPTGETESTAAFFPNGRGTLADYNLDDVFGDLDRDADGRATATLRGREQQLAITLGRGYRSLVIYSPNPDGTGRGSQIPPPDPNAPPSPARGGRGGRGRGPANPLATPDFICLEPMAGITNALNLAHRGLYDDLQYIEPGATWEASFWIEPSGF